MTPALSISHLRKVYRSGTVAVEDISLQAAEGAFIYYEEARGAVPTAEQRAPWPTFDADVAKADEVIVPVQLTKW